MRIKSNSFILVAAAAAALLVWSPGATDATLLAAGSGFIRLRVAGPLRACRGNPLEPGQLAPT